MSFKRFAKYAAIGLGVLGGIALVVASHGALLAPLGAWAGVVYGSAIGATVLTGALGAASIVGDVLSFNRKKKAQSEARAMSVGIEQRYSAVRPPPSIGYGIGNVQGQLPVNHFIPGQQQEPPSLAH